MLDLKQKIINLQFKFSTGLLNLMLTPTMQSCELFSVEKGIVILRCISLLNLRVTISADIFDKTRDKIGN